MSKITYGDKTAVEPQVSHGTQFWASDANEVKTVVNDNAESTNITTTVLLDKVKGSWVNTPTDPITGVIPVDLTGAINGGTSAIWFKGTSVSFTGVTVTIQSGELIENQLALVWIIYDGGSGACSVNIQNGYTGVLPGGVLFFDIFTGTTIDVLKWTKNNPDPTHVSITQNGEAILASDAVSTTNFVNNLIGVDPIGLTALETVSFDIDCALQGENSWGIGITKDLTFTANQDRVTIQKANSTQVNLVLREGGATTYVLAATLDISSVKTIKIVIDATDINYYYWTTSWVLLGTTTHSSSGNWYPVIWKDSNTSQSANTLNVDNFYITDTDFTTQFPV